MLHTQLSNLHALSCISSQQFFELDTTVFQILELEKLSLREAQLFIQVTYLELTELKFKVNFILMMHHHRLGPTFLSEDTISGPCKSCLHHLHSSSCDLLHSLLQPCYQWSQPGRQKPCRLTLGLILLNHARLCPRFCTALYLFSPSIPEKSEGVRATPPKKKKTSSLTQVSPVCYVNLTSPSLNTFICKTEVLIPIPLEFSLEIKFIQENVRYVEMPITTGRKCVISLLLLVWKTPLSLKAQIKVSFCHGLISSSSILWELSISPKLASVHQTILTTGEWVLHYLISVGIQNLSLSYHKWDKPLFVN